jgi:transposase
VFDGTTLLFGLPGVRVERVERSRTDTRSAHRDDGTGGGGVPVVRGVGMSAKERVSTSPRDIPYLEDRIVLRWSKTTRWRCREAIAGAAPSPNP